MVGDDVSQEVAVSREGIRPFKPESSTAATQHVSLNTSAGVRAVIGRCQRSQIEDVTNGGYKVAQGPEATTKVANFITFNPYTCLKLINQLDRSGSVEDGNAIFRTGVEPTERDAKGC